MFQKMFHRVRMWIKKGSGESRELRSRKDVAVSMHGRTPKSQLSSSGMQKRKVHNMMVRTSSKWHAWDERAWELRRAPSSQQPARESPGRVEAEKPRSIQQKSVYRKGETRRSRSIQQKSMHRKRDKEVSRHVRKTEIWDTRGLTANNGHSTDHSVAESQRDAAHVAACETLSTWSRAVSNRLSLLPKTFTCNAPRGWERTPAARETAFRPDSGEQKIHNARRTRTYEYSQQVESREKYAA